MAINSSIVVPGDLLTVRRELMVVISVILHRLTNVWQVTAVKLGKEFGLGASRPMFPRDHLAMLIDTGEAKIISRAQ